MADTQQTETVTGILDWETPHEGRIRQWNNGPVSKDSDPYIPASLKEEYPLRAGQLLTTTVVQKKSKNKKPGKPRNVRSVVSEITAIEGIHPEEFAKHTTFEEMIVIDPSPRSHLE